MIANLTQVDQQFADWAATLGMPAEAILRLLMAGAAGGLVGIERQIRGRDAGFRTNLLVCVGSALAMIASISVSSKSFPHPPSSSVVNDPARIAYGVMAGIGFLGAGAINKSNGSIRGVTTAAGIWCVAALGLAAGLGMYGLTIAATIVVVGALWMLQQVERMLPQQRYATLRVRRAWETGCVGRTVEFVRSRKLSVLDAEFDRTGDPNRVIITLFVEFQSRTPLHDFEHLFEGDSECELIAVGEE